MSTRVYIPSSTKGLHDLLVSGGLGPVPLLGHAVTPELREALREVGEEEWEYDVLMTAAQLAGLIADGSTSAVEVTRAHLDRITAVDERVHAYLHVDAEGALDGEVGQVLFSHVSHGVLPNSLRARVQRSNALAPLQGL